MRNAEKKPITLNKDSAKQLGRALTGEYSFVLLFSCAQRFFPTKPFAPVTRIFINYSERMSRAFALGRRPRSS